MNLAADIQGPLMIHPNDFEIPLTFLFAPSLGMFCLFSEAKY